MSGATHVVDDSSAGWVKQTTGRPLILFRIMSCAASNTEELSFTDTTFRVITSTAFIADFRLAPAS